VETADASVGRHFIPIETPKHVAAIVAVCKEEVGMGRMLSFIGYRLVSPDDSRSNDDRDDDTGEQADSIRYYVVRIATTVMNEKLSELQPNTNGFGYEQA
jgi:hypothetical protein